MTIRATLGRALHRLAAQVAPAAVPAVRAYYEGASQTRRTRGWRAPTVGANTALVGSLGTLRDRARASVRNDGYSGAAISALVSNEVGVGIVPQSQAPDFRLPAGRQWREVVREAWDDWTLAADADGLLEFYGLQALAVRGWREGGEMFVRLRPRLLQDGLAVPLQLQLLEPELVPHTVQAASRTGNPIRAGIEFDAIGRRVAYWCYQQRPEELDPGMGSGLMVRIPADQMIHLYQPLRAGQLRGLPVLTQALIRLRGLDTYDDAVLVRQQISNLFAGFVKPPALDAAEAIDPITGQPIETEDDQAILGLEPGIIRELAPGEDITFANPPAATGYAEFMAAQLRGASVAAGIPYELLTGDLGDVSDRSLRVIVQDFRQRIEQGQYHIIAHMLNQPIWDAWLARGILSGALAVPPDYWRSPRPWHRVEWVPPAKPYIHPVQDVEHELLMVAAGFKSPIQVARERGWSIEQIYRETEAAKALAARHGLTFDWSRPAPAPAQPPARD